MPNVDLLRRTLAYIEEHPEEWDQAFWCGTSMCFAGHAAITLSGGRRADGGDYLVAEPGDAPEDAYDGEVHVRERAMRLLDLPYHRACALFACGNTLGDLRRLVADLCSDSDSGES